MSLASSVPLGCDVVLITVGDQPKPSKPAAATKRSRRSVALTPQILAKLRQHHTPQTERKMAAGPAWRDHGLIFASETGAPLDPENFSRIFAKLCNRAGLGRWHPHELRHSGASLMLAQDTPPHVVPEILGHASITITKDVYGHLVEGDAAGRRRVHEPGAFRARTGRRGSQRGSQSHEKDPSQEPVGACDLGALGGTRTPAF